MEVIRIGNEVFTSNVYLLSNPSDSKLWLIDIGDFDSLRPLLENRIVEGVFLTHGHYDHISGINQLQETYPACMVYASSFTHESLYSEKLNLSFYHENPVVYKGNSVCDLREGNQMELFQNVFLEVIETPGHNPGCLTFVVGDYLFTGDSFIPGIPVVTKLKGGDKGKNLESLQIINSLIHDTTRICPGHGPVYTATQLKSATSDNFLKEGFGKIEIIA